MIVPLEPKYYRAIAEAHVELDPTAFLHDSREIGIRFREKVFYPALQNDPGAFVWLYLYEGVLAGYIVGVKNNQEFYQKLRQTKPFYVLWLVLKNTLRNPARLIKYLRIKQTLESSYFKEAVWAEILSFGVLSQFRKRAFKEKTGVHIAKELFEKATGTFHHWKIPQFKVITTQENQAANRFYQNKGCQIMQTTSPFGSPCNVFVGNTHE